MDDCCKKIADNVRQVLDKNKISYDEEALSGDSCDPEAVGKLLEALVASENGLSNPDAKILEVMSHKLRTPVGAVLWNIEMLLSGSYGDLTESQREILQDTYELSKKMRETINSSIKNPDQQ